MRREHDRAAARCVLRDRVVRARARDARVHAPGRLVEQEHVRRRPRRPRRSRPVAARRRRGCAGGGRRAWSRPRRVEPSVDGAVVAAAEQPQRLGELAPHGRCEQQRVRVLGHVGGRAARRRRGRAPASSSRPSARSRVVLPAPLRPSSATTSPRATSTSTSVQHRAARRASTRSVRARRRACSPGWRRQRVRLPARGAEIGASHARSAGVAHGERRRVPAEQPTEAGDGRRAGVVREHGAAALPARRRCARRRSITARSASGAARSSRCSASSTVVPRSALRRATAASTSSAPCGSSCDVGSSSTSADGAAASAPAIAQRWRSPPESVAGERSRRCAMPSASSTSSTRRRIAASVECRGSRARTRRRPRPGRRRTGPRGPGARSRRRRRARGGWCVRVERPNATTSPAKRPPGRVRHEPVRAPQQRALARARRPDDEQDLARRRPSRSTSSSAGPAVGIRERRRRGTRSRSRRHRLATLWRRSAGSSGSCDAETERGAPATGRITSAGEKVERRPAERARAPRERVVAEHDERASAAGAASDDTAITRQSAPCQPARAVPVRPRSTRREQRPRPTSPTAPHEPEDDGRELGASPDERDERARRARATHAEPAPSGGPSRAAAPAAAEAARVHRLGQRRPRAPGRVSSTGTMSRTRRPRRTTGRRCGPGRPRGRADRRRSSTGRTPGRRSRPAPSSWNARGADCTSS